MSQDVTIELRPITVQDLADGRCLLCHRPARDGCWTCARCHGQLMREGLADTIKAAVADAEAAVREKERA